MPNETTKRYAVLIDSANIHANRIDNILSEIRARGMPTILRAYGDFSSARQGWEKKTFQTHAVVPVQQFPCTKGKNATDIRLVIDAMDMLHRDIVDAFAIVSSDSDFTPLAIRLREAGKEVIVRGEAKTPTAFRKACTDFKQINPPDPAKSNAQRKSDKTGLAAASVATRAEKATGQTIKGGSPVLTLLKGSAQPPPPTERTPATTAIPKETIKLICNKIDQVKSNSQKTHVCFLKSLSKIIDNENISLSPHSDLRQFIQAYPDFFVLKDEGSKPIVEIVNPKPRS